MARNSEQRGIVAYLDSFPLLRVLRDRQARLALLRQFPKEMILQSETQEELGTLLASVLRPQGVEKTFRVWGNVRNAG